MTFKLDKKTWIATNDQWDTYNEKTGVFTAPNGFSMKTKPVSKAAQKWAEEYLKILES